MHWPVCVCVCVFFFQAEDGIRDAQESRGLGDVYKRQSLDLVGVQISGVGYADISANAYHNGSSWAKRNSSYESWIVNQSVNTSNTGDWAIYHTNAGATPPGNRLFTITSSGNVGIGTSAPTQRLQVNGVIGAYSDADSWIAIYPVSYTHLTLPTIYSV